MKAQGIRLLDVYALGPFMIYFGVKAKKMPPWARAAMVMAGIGTVAYNLENYLKLEKAGNG